MTADRAQITAERARYRAFISYSHADTACANWLHHALETYRIPAKLVGRETAIGAVPRRLTPIFKDREELAASGDLSAGLKESLGGSEFLIVIASPAAARSRWVNEEVRTYKQMHGEARVLVVISSGEPGGAKDECFPSAVRFRVEADGSIGSTPAEPIAADLRPHGDGKRLAKLKLVAGLTGLKLDELVQREAQRRQRRMTWLAAASIALAAVMLVLTLVAVRARAEAEHQRSQADGLVEFMLTDLRKKLEPVGRLDALDVVGQRALKYYAGQQPGSLDADALGRRSRALHLVGEVRSLRGDSEGALGAFRQAAATTAELLARDPHNGQRIFDHAQSVFWVGSIAYARGQTKEAEAAFRDYKKYADELVAIDPKKADWQMEVSYAASNLGVLLNDEGRYAEAEQAFTRALKVAEGAAARKPGDSSGQVVLGAAYSWLARSQGSQDHYDAAIATYRRETGVYQKLLKTDSGNNSAKRSFAVALSSIGRLELERGSVSAARDAVTQASAISQALLSIEPNNTDWRVADVKTRIVLADALRYSGQPLPAWAEYELTNRSLNVLNAKDAKNVEWNITLRSRLELLQAWLLAADGSSELALQHASQAADRMSRRSNESDPEYIVTQARAGLLAGEMDARLGRPGAASAAWKASDALITGPDAGHDSMLLAARFALRKRLGQRADAARIAAILDQRGFRHPFYLGEKQGKP